jgi:hypothetical protein
MPKMHRYKQPTYHGAPALAAAPTFTTFNGVDYDFLNVVSEGAGAGGSAFFPTHKPSGPNVGTYGVAFGEDATSSNTNRGIRALAENTDTLDDWMHRDLAVPVRTASVTAGAPVSSIVLPADTYVGTGVGYPIDSLFSVLDANHEEILNGDDKVAVASIAGATIGDGFSAVSITLTLSHAIPSGTTYYVVYATRSNLATIPEYALVSVGLRASDEVAADVSRMIGHLKGEPSGAWDQNPIFSTYNLGMGGLNSMYSRASSGGTFSSQTGVTSTTRDTAGAGAEVYATGRGLAAIMDDTFMGYTSTTRNVDPVQALFRAESNGIPTGGHGRSGFVALMRGAHAGNGDSGAPVGIGSYRRMGVGSFTVVNEGGTATVTAGPGTQLLDIDLGTNLQAGGGGSTRMKLGYDLIRVRLPATIAGNPTLGDREVSFRVVAMPASDTVRVVGLDGYLPTQLTGLAGSITVDVIAWYSAQIVQGMGSGSAARWIDRPVLSGGGGGTNAMFNSIAAVEDAGLALFPLVNNDSNMGYGGGPAVRVFGEPNDTALSWGGRNSDGTITERAYLHSTGEVFAVGSHTEFAAIGRVGSHGTAVRAARVTREFAQAPRLYVDYTGPSSINAIIFRVDSDQTFPRTSANTERTQRDGYTLAGPTTPGAKFPSAFLLNITAATNNTFRVSMPARDVVIGDEISVVLILRPTAGATLLVEFTSHLYSTGTPAQFFRAGGFDSAGVVAYATTTTTAKVVQKKFRCVWSGTHDTNDIAVYWLEVDSSELTFGSPESVASFKVSGTTGLEVTDIVEVVNAANTIVNINQGF